jgi:hypothetical protein
MRCRRYLGSAVSLVFQSRGSFVTGADFMPNFPGYVELASAPDTAALQTVVYDSPRGAEKAVRAEPTLGGLTMDAQGPCPPEAVWVSWISYSGNAFTVGAMLNGQRLPIV